MKFKIETMKLVRDKIPKIVKEKGINSYKFKNVQNDELFYTLLKKKLLEEVNEFVESDSVEELADILEVFYTILNFKNIKIEDVEKIRVKKLKGRGGFQKRILLVSKKEP